MLPTAISIHADAQRLKLQRISMTRFLLTTTTIFLLSWMAGARVVTADSHNPHRPNIVMILVDDLGYSDIGCYGSRYYQTPNIDRLADQGMRFTDAYAACPVCSPTRLSIVAGKYPARVGLTDWLAGDRWPDNSPLRHSQWQKYMPPTEITVAEALRTNGYETAMIGKWHLNANKKFDVEMQKQTAADVQGFEVLQPLGRNQSDKQVSSMTDSAIEFLTKNRECPFLLYFAHFAVHTPLEAKPNLIKKYEKLADPSDPQSNPIYAGMVETVDTSVGRLVATLDELNLADNTMVVFFSDNGGLHVIEAPNTPATSNEPLRGGKGYIDEGGIRVPMIVRWPGVVPAASTCTTPVSSVDFYPTFLEITGTTKPSQQQLDGESLMPILKNKGTLQRDAIFWHYPHYSNQGGLPAGAMRQGDFKLVEHYHSGHTRLYNVVNDIGEQHDLVAQMPGETAAMKKKFYRWLESVGSRAPSPNLTYDPSKPLYSKASKAPKQWQASGKAILRAEEIE